MPGPRFVLTLAIGLAVSYLCLALWVTARDYASSTSFLRGMGFRLATFPVAWVAEFFHRPLDVKNHLHVMVALGVCTALAFAAGWGIGRLLQICFFK